MNKTLLCLATSLAVVPALTYADSPYFSLKDGDGFKRFSVSVGALHVMPQGKAQPIQINTAIKMVRWRKMAPLKSILCLRT